MKRYRYTGGPRTVQLHSSSAFRRGMLVGIGDNLGLYEVLDTHPHSTLTVRPVALTRRYRAWLAVRRLVRR